MQGLRRFWEWFAGDDGFRNFIYFVDPNLERQGADLGCPCCGVEPDEPGGVCEQVECDAYLEVA